MTTSRERAAGFVLLVGGAGFLVYAARYPIDTPANPGPGLFPLMVGAALVILAAIQVVRSIRKGAPAAAEEGADERPAGARETGAALMVALLVVYLLAVTRLGFFASTFVFVVAASRLMGARVWGKPLALSAGIAIFCYLLFIVWLKMSFPRGLLP